MVARDTDFTLLTALPFESRLSRSLGLNRHSIDREPAVTVYTGTVAGYEVALVESGLRATRLETLPTIPELAPRGGIISVGLAGGLTPELPAAAVVTARETLIDQVTFPADQRLLEALEAGGAIAVDRVATVPEIIFEVAEKQKAQERTHAAAADMESGIIARWAAERQIPFAVVRGISDPAGSALPPEVGSTHWGLGSIRSLPAFLLLAVRALRARAAIARVLKHSLEELARNDWRPA